MDPKETQGSGEAVGSSSTPSSSDTFSFDQLYFMGKVYVFPPLFVTKADVLKDTEEEVPQDPAQPLEEKLQKAKVLDTEKLRDTKDRLKGERAEFRVIEMVRCQLQASTEENDLPSFILHNVSLGQSESDILILSRKWGVVVMEVKATESSKAFSPVQKAVKQLKEAMRNVQEDLKGLLKSTGVKGLVALPGLSRKTEPEQPLKNLVKGSSIELVLGEETFLESLTPGADCDGWNTCSPRVDSPDTAFKMAATKFLSVEPWGPGDVLAALVESHRTWLLTEKQMEVRDLKHGRVHIWGPPGSGKTLLLLHRARRWVQEGKAVVVTSGSKKYDVLEAHIGRVIMREQEEGVEKRIHICRHFRDIDEAVKNLKMQQAAKEQESEPARKKNKSQQPHAELEICLVIDELHEAEAIETVIEVVKSHNIQQCWSADVRYIQKMDDNATNKQQADEAQNLGWKSRELLECIRCPSHIVELLNRLVEGSGQHQSIRACSVPRPRAFQGVTVVDLAWHQHHVVGQADVDTQPDLTTTLERLSQCQKFRADLTEALQLQHSNKELWKRWVALCTGRGLYKGLRVLASRLKGLGISAVCELNNETLGKAKIFVNVLASRLRQQKAATTGKPSEEEAVAAWRERVVAGLDEHGEPAMHVVWHEYFRGLEKEGVLLIHWDQEDFQDHADQDDVTKDRKSRHCQEWIQAASRCQGQLVVVLLSPSPAGSLLPKHPPPTPISTSTPTPTFTPTSASTPTPTSTLTSTPTPTFTPTSASTPTPTPTSTLTSNPNSTSTSTSTPNPTFTSNPTPTPTPHLPPPPPPTPHV